MVQGVGGGLISQLPQGNVSLQSQVLYVNSERPTWSVAKLCKAEVDMAGAGMRAPAGDGSSAAGSGGVCEAWAACRRSLIKSIAASRIA